jgi:transaldolase
LDGRGALSREAAAVARAHAAHRPPPSDPTSPPHQTAIERAVSYNKCASLTGDARKACVFDKALVNVGALFAAKVGGRVSTEVDSRCARDAGALVSRGQGLVAAYKEMGVPLDKVLLRLPATWEGIEAAKRLEADGIPTHLVLVASFVQAAAAAQAGARVIQPNAGHLADWYRAHPNYIRDPKGPREDTGYRSAVNPGVELSKRIWAYCRIRHPASLVMVSGIRTREDALALAGVDFLVAGPRVLDALAATPTRSGYNDGLSGAAEEEETGARLTDAVAAAYSFDAETPVTRAAFDEQLGLVGRDILDEGVARLSADVVKLLPLMTSMVYGHE